MTAAALLLLLALQGQARDLGGHEEPKPAAQTETLSSRRATLEELWQRHILPPDQSDWSARDVDFLRKIVVVEKDAIAYLRHRPGGERPWMERPRSGGPPKLTKAGYERYLFLLSQDAIGYFESKGADAKWALKLQDWDGKPMFDESGLITEDGLRTYRRARLNLKVFWRSPDGEIFGTRRPPMKNP